MSEFRNPYISRVIIKNFRNFLDVDVILTHKQVIIGENNIGKSNFLRAIQLILDREFSDIDRQLTENDFHDSYLGKAMDNGEVIEIIIHIQGYQHNKKLEAQFVDAIINSDPPTLQFKYKYFPEYDDEKNILKYKYEIYKGKDEDKKFTYEDRNYINIHVIKALRDVERELRAGKNSVLYKLVKQYDIAKDDLDEISEAMQLAADKVLELDEIVHIKEAIQDRFATLSGLQADTTVTLRTFDVDTERLLFALQAYMGLQQRPVEELSLGLANILYVSLMLLLLKDKTVKPIIKSDEFNELLKKDFLNILSHSYTNSQNGNYILNKNIDNDFFNRLYSFMGEYSKHQAFTILAVEEPEAHLHPLLQRLIYREVLHRSNTSVIFTSHSTFITSVTPLNSIVHIRKVEGASKIYSTATLTMDSKVKNDIERYLDAKRGEIYFGKGIILTEGITEEFLVPAAAELLELSLDDYGIVVCNINSTNFQPYIRLLNTLNIPWILFTDGDYYEVIKIKDTATGEDLIKKKYHIMSTDDDEANFRGNENISNILVNLGILSEDEIPEDFDKQDKLFREKGCYIGNYTYEVDMFLSSEDGDIETIKNIYSELVTGGDKMRENFYSDLDKGAFWSALKKIENNIGKGRFAQRLSNSMTESMIPNYIKKGITAMVKKIKKEYE